MATVCPKCSRSLFKSHTRGRLETLIKRFTNYRPYRCPQCSWRGFLPKRAERVSMGARRLTYLAIGAVVAIVGLIVVLHFVNQVEYGPPDLPG